MKNLLPVGRGGQCKAIEDMKMDDWNVGWNEGLLTAVSMKDMDMSREAVIEKIEVSYALSNEKAAALVESRW
jgi:hypothetical protein